MKTGKWQARTRQELIIEVWEALDCESVGERELWAIQSELRKTFGPGAIISPAAIARELADEGAVLRHPEVLNCDTKWREEQLTDLFAPEELNFSSLALARDSLQTIAKVYRSITHKADQPKLKRLNELILQHRQEAVLVSRSKIVSQHERLIAKEVAQWLAVWLEQPDIFSDWLALRERSPEFQKQFG